MHTGVADVHAVQKQHVEVNIQIQRAAEALDQGHGAGLCHGFCEARLAGQMRGDGAVDDGQRPGHGLGVAGKQEPQWKRQAQHPLSHGLMRQDVVYQQGSAIRHSACAATGAETAPFAAKSDQFFIVAGLTADPEKTMSIGGIKAILPEICIY